MIYRSLTDLPPAYGPSALTIGNFDGVHAAHRHLMRRVVEVARAHGLRATVLTFEPHPTRVVAPDRSPRLMTTTAERCALMLAEGVDDVVVLPFTPAFAQIEPDAFVRDIVAGRLRARYVHVGANFRFGAAQRGDVKVLAALGHTYGFETEVVEGLRRHGRIVSSSAVRALVEQGGTALAGRFLERPYAIEGDVVTGFGIGSRETVPTLNLATVAELLPANGVYVTRTFDSGSGRQWESITNIGMRPTFDGSERTIETFLISPFDGETPSHIRLAFLRRLRDERRFPSAEALKQQIIKDVQRTKAYFRRLKRWARGNAC